MDPYFPRPNISPPIGFTICSISPDYGCPDAFLLRLDENGRYLASKVFSGGGTEIATAVEVDADDIAHVVGFTDSTRAGAIYGDPSLFPTTGDAFQRSGNSSLDMFYSQVKPNMELQYATYWGRYGASSVFLDGTDVYIGGSTSWPDFPGGEREEHFPIQPAGISRYSGGQFDGVVVKLRR